MSGRLVILAAGGTGGHVFPAEALAGALAARGFRLALVTDDRGSAYGGTLGTLETHRLPIRKMTGNLLRRLIGAASLLPGYLAARRLLAMLKPAAVVGFGGYPSLPTMFAASPMGRTALHEQNAILGRVNRLVASRVDAVATSFAETKGVGTNAVLVGNPVRAAVQALRDTTYAPPVAGEKLRLLVTGGSQGASVFGRVMPAALALLSSDQRQRISIVQQTRAEDAETVQSHYRTLGLDATVAPFFADLPQRMAEAHLVIARAGASTVAELACIGRPALLVPYMHATDDHQTANAQALAATGAAWLIPEPQFSADDLAARISSLLAAPASLSDMAKAAHGFGRPDAAERLADLVQRLAEGTR
ncbi:MAG: undecaprenyldiphospho-muramoylpentapeptide beta-N-acetylglucosaminyltransferase [Telmatospirillum sp.]|nr:undecaprenyldiphospho-muramoylpentapeptide beta-N-acetylglucosaminyltransferase [Telmatospirillum sp.]